MSTEEEHVAAVKTALTAATAIPYDLDDVPKNIPPMYTEVTVSRRFGGNPRSTSRSGVTGWRVTTRAVAKTVSNARLMRKRQHLALEDVRLTVGGLETTGLDFETAEIIGLDNGWWSGLTTWTYVH